VSEDERAIRDVIATWARATRAGDTPTVLSLMAEDVVFLGPGRPAMTGRAAFAEASRGQQGPGAPSIDATIDVREVQVDGRLAYAWSELKVSVTPPARPTQRLAGPVLTIFRKEQDGRWRLARDANMLTPAS
jgi:uncharacterized protein (TIGR02246 family)